MCSDKNPPIETIRDRENPLYLMLLATATLADSHEGLQSQATTCHGDVYHTNRNGYEIYITPEEEKTTIEFRSSYRSNEDTHVQQLTQRYTLTDEEIHCQLLTHELRNGESLKTLARASLNRIDWDTAVKLSNEADNAKGSLLSKVREISHN
jgi:hypothetical protein